MRPAPPEHHGWIAQRAQVIVGAAFRAVEAVDEAGEIKGMIGFDGWMPNSVQMHVAMESPIAFRRLLRPAFAIAFQLRQIATCVVMSTNERSLKLVKHVGFRETFRAKDWWDVGVDLVFFEMHRRECRWIPESIKEAAWAA